MDCKHASRLMTQSMDRPLHWREWVALKIHLAICRMCRQFFSQLRLMRTALRRMVNHVEADESVKLPEDARERISKALDQQP